MSGTPKAPEIGGVTGTSAPGAPGSLDEAVSDPRIALRLRASFAESGGEERDRCRPHMPTITLSATPKGNGFQATVTFPGDGVSISSAEAYPTIRLDRLPPPTLRDRTSPVRRTIAVQRRAL